MRKREKRAQRKAERAAAVEATAAEEAAAWEALLAEIRAQQCPSCGSATVARLSYGLPRFTPALNAALDAGFIFLAGCSFAPEDPVWVCRNCKHHWGRVCPPQEKGPSPGATPATEA